MSRKDLNIWAIFGAPVAVFVLSLTGLIGALLADGVWDAVFSALLASTVIVTVWALVQRRR
ncbi:MAG: hypothetical protein EPO54_06525 [Brevundimonas sp.]|nr:MAG: hypothetical protein EPO54_06525 [Brevundimonas sp.]